MPSCTLPAGAVDPDSPAGGHWTRVGRALFCALPSVAWGASLGSAGGRGSIAQWFLQLPLAGEAGAALLLPEAGRREGRSSGWSRG